MTKTYFKLLGFGVLLTVLISIFSAMGIILEVDDNNSLVLQIIAFSIATVTLVFYMRKKGEGLKTFGFRRGEYNVIITLFMLLVVFIQPIVMGVNGSVSLDTVILIIIQMLLVGFVEEVLFRAVFLYFLAENTKKYILFSSFVFGMLHMASGINPDSSQCLVILQIVNALLLGVVFSLLYLKTNSIYTTILFHAVFNILASVSLDNSPTKNILAVSILVIVYILFIFYLTKLMPKSK